MIANTLLSSCVLLSSVFASLTQAQDVGQLRSDLNGIDAIFKADSGYDDASEAYNRRYTYEPAAVVYPSSADQVSQAIKAATGQGLSVAARGGGHSYAALGLGGEDNAFVIDLSNMADISVDGSSKIGYIGGGARLGDVALALNDAGRGMPHGSCPYVGVGGHFALGGFGFQSRMWGLSLDNINSFEIVLANGTVADVSSESYPDLYWALQGAGSSFGVITQYRVNTFETPAAAVHYTYQWNFAAEDAISHIQEWQDFVQTNIPPALGAEITFGKGSWSGSISFNLVGVFYGNQDDLESTLQPYLSQLPSPAWSSLTPGNYIDSVRTLAGDTPLDTSTQPNGDDTFYAKSLMVPAMSDAAVRSWVYNMAYDGFNSDTAWFCQLELYGGSNSKINEVASDATAFAHRDAMNTIQFYASSSSYSPPYPQDGFGFLDNMVSQITQNQDLGEVPAAYVNYIDTRLDNPQQAYYGANSGRLSTLKGQYDPKAVFRFPSAVQAS